MQSAKEKIVKFCTYTERCHRQVKDRLYTYRCTTPEVNELIAWCVEQDLLNEERFVLTFVSSHYRGNKWGRVKIGYFLGTYRVSGYLITKGLKSIDEEEYLNIAYALAKRTWDTSKTLMHVVNKLKQRGYENYIIDNVVKRIKDGG